MHKYCSGGAGTLPPDRPLALQHPSVPVVGVEPPIVLYKSLLTTSPSWGAPVAAWRGGTGVHGAAGGQLLSGAALWARWVLHHGFLACSYPRFLYRGCQ